MTDYPLSTEQISQYRRDGYIALKGVVVGNELKQLRSAVEEAVAAETLNDNRSFTEKGVYEQIFIQKVNLWTRFPNVKDFVLSRKFGNIAARLQGKRMRVWHDQALFKEPELGKKTPWHQDAHYWPHDNCRESLSIWIALQDATIENGCMTFIPTTHELDSLPPVDLGVPDDIFEWAPQFKGLKGEAVELKAGSVTFHNGLTFHYAGPNKSTVMREAFAILYMPDGIRYTGKKHVVTDPLVEKGQLENGDVLDGEMFPLVSE
jgi:phytanoyl-CoA hydroxylase